jgi:hypothetical protein
VNNDGLGNWQWFGAHSVAPNGRIDAIWNDTRNSGSATVSELFYAYSVDAGQSWLGNIPVSPPFNSSLGFPNQAKIGDYYTLVSDEAGTNVAYAATFNGEQDVYHVRLFPDCNENGISDVTDVATGSSSDCNQDQILDECQGLNCDPAGSVPVGGGVLETPLTVERFAFGDLRLTWGASCAATDTDFEVYEGTLGDFASHVPVACTTSGVKKLLFTPSAGSAYYLVVPRNVLVEGSYGVDSAGAQRPPSASACLLNYSAPCP